MRSTRLLITFAAVAAVALPTAGADAASRLSLRIANKTAKKSAANVAKTYSDDLDTTIDSYDLSPCDRTGRRKADCDVTYVLYDCPNGLNPRVNPPENLKLVRESLLGGRAVEIRPSPIRPILGLAGQTDQKQEANTGRGTFHNFSV